jgi:hypothetical protein
MSIYYSIVNPIIALPSVYKMNGIVYYCAYFCYGIPLALLYKFYSSCIIKEFNGLSVDYVAHYTNLASSSTRKELRSLSQLSVIYGIFNHITGTT